MNNFNNFQNMDNSPPPNMNSNNTMFMSSNFQKGPNMNQPNNNFNLMNNNPNTMVQSQSFKRKLHVQLTPDENRLLLF